MGKQKNIDAKMLDIKEGRVRLYHNEFESIIAALASIKMMRSRLADLKRVAMLKDRKTWRKLKAGVELMESGIVEYTTKMSCKQEHSLQINSGNVYFTASPNQGCFNMPQKEYYILVTAARIGACSRCENCMNKRDWQQCSLCQILDTVPVREGKFERSNTLMDVCPYAIREGEFKID